MCATTRVLAGWTGFVLSEIKTVFLSTFSVSARNTARSHPRSTYRSTAPPGRGSPQPTPYTSMPVGPGGTTGPAGHGSSPTVTSRRATQPPAVLVLGHARGDAILGRHRIVDGDDAAFARAGEGAGGVNRLVQDGLLGRGFVLIRSNRLLREGRRASSGGWPAAGGSLGVVICPVWHLVRVKPCKMPYIRIL